VNILLTGGGGFIGSHLPVRGSGCYGAPAVETSLPDKQMPCGARQPLHGIRAVPALVRQPARMLYRGGKIKASNRSALAFSSEATTRKISLTESIPRNSPTSFKDILRVVASDEKAR